MQDGTKEYRKALEVLGARKTRAATHNALNKLSAHSVDTKLAGLVRAVMNDFHTTTTNTQAISLSEMGSIRKSVSALEAYCKIKVEDRPSPP